jgi:hypothetical protein
LSSQFKVEPWSHDKNPWGIEMGVAGKYGVITTLIIISAFRSGDPGNISVS